ncbi:MAG: glyoxalase superfamily protein [Bacteroidota bacterium]
MERRKQDKHIEYYFFAPDVRREIQKLNANKQNNGNIRLKGVPAFRTFDYKEAINFYLDSLGFTIDWEHRFGPGEYDRI